jgi:hypothetical protein
MMVKGIKTRGKLDSLFDKNQMMKDQKRLEKSQNTSMIEKQIILFRGYK